MKDHTRRVLYFDSILKTECLKGLLVSEVISCPEWGDPSFSRRYLMELGGSDPSLVQVEVEGTRCTLFAGVHDGKVERFGTQQVVVDALLNYEANGKQCFVVDSYMERELSRTSITGLLRNQLRAPFPCFYIALPDTKGLGTASLVADPEGWGDWEEEGVHRVGGVFVSQHGRHLSLVIVGAPVEGGKAGDVPTAHLSINLDSVNWESPSGLEDYLANVVDESRLDVAYDGDPGTGVTTLRDIDPGAREDPQSRGAFSMLVNSLNHALRLSVNLCLYVNSRAPDLTRERIVSAQERQLVRKIAGTTRSRSVVRLRKKLAACTSTSFTYVGRAYEGPGDGRARHFRRAHWHTYYVCPRKRPNGEPLPLSEQATEILWVGMTEVNKGAKDAVDGRMYIVEDRGGS